MSTRNQHEGNEVHEPQHMIQDQTTHYRRRNYVPPCVRPIRDARETYSAEVGLSENSTGYLRS